MAGIIMLIAVLIYAILGGCLTIYLAFSKEFFHMMYEDDKMKKLEITDTRMVVICVLSLLVFWVCWLPLICIAAIKDMRGI